MTKQLNIYQRMLGVMADIDYIQKGPKSVNGQYKFASHDQVTGSLHPYLVKHGILPVTTVESESQEGNRTKVILLIDFVNVDLPTDKISVRYFGYGIDSGDKGPGKAISYAFKIACLKGFMLETGEDPDKDANACYEPPKCLEFDSLLPEMSDADNDKLIKFLNHSAETLKKNVEEVKREAVARMDDFLRAFKKWAPKN
jgi:hypothetical protein